MESIIVQTPRTAVKSDLAKNHVVLQGGQRVTENVLPADSYSATSANWSVHPPSTTTIVDRYVKAKFYVEVKSDVDFILGSKEGLRQFPIAAVTDVLTVQINGESISENVADIGSALLCYGNGPSDRTKSWSTTAAMPDQYQKYSDWTTLGSARNPLADYGENAGEMSRGGFPYTQVDSKTLRYEITEPLLLSPFFQGVGAQEEGLVNVNQMNITFRFQDLNRVWSSDGTTGTTYTATFYQTPELSVSYITPDLLQPIPALQTLPYHKNQIYKKSMAPLASEASTTAYSDSVKLNQVPRRVLLFAKHDQASQSPLTSDSFLGIENVSLTFNNQNSLLSSASQQDLHEISRRNGCNLAWPQFSKYRGSVFCAEFGKDIGLPDSLAPGTISQNTISAQVRFKNKDTASFDATFYMVLIMEGTFSVSEGQARASLGNLTEQVVLQSKQHSAEMPHQAYEQLHGGSFWGSLKNIVHKVAGVVSKAAPIAGKIAGAIAPELVPVINTVGSVAGAASRATGGGMTGGSTVGGRLSRAQVRRR